MPQSKEAKFALYDEVHTSLIEVQNHLFDVIVGLLEIEGSFYLRALAETASDIVGKSILHVVTMKRENNK